MIISVSGLDGSGKSTQILKLIDNLKKDGFSTKYVWARGGYTPGFELIKKTLRNIFKEKLPPAGQSEVRQRQLNNTTIQKLWLSIAIFDLIILWGVYIRALSFINSIVICDRYIGDTLLDFRQNFPSSNFEKSILWKILEFVTPNPNVSFIFVVPVSVSQRRSLEKEEPFPDSEKTLIWRLKNYSDTTLFPSESFILIDGCRELNDICQEVYSIVQSSIARKGK